LINQKIFIKQNFFNKTGKQKQFKEGDYMSWKILKIHAHSYTISIEKCLSLDYPGKVVQ
jgi:hypothetical protein